MAQLLPEGKQSFTTATGTPLVGGKLYTYAAGTSTPKATFADSAGTTPNANPVVMDARGEATIFWAGAYKVVLRDALDNLIYTVDNVGSGSDGPSGDEILALLAASNGATLIGFQQTAIGAVARNVALVLAEEIRFSDFLTAAQLADYQARTEAFDLVIPLNLFASAVRGRRGRMGAGTAKCSGKWPFDPLYPSIITADGWNSDATRRGTWLHFTDPTVNALEVVYSYAQWPAGGGADAHRAYDIANNIVPLGNSDNLVRFEGIGFVGPGVNTTAGSQSIQLAGVGPETQPTGHGCFAYWANNLQLVDCWFEGFPSLGVKFMWCFGSLVRGGYIVGNKAGGMAAVNTNNLLTIDGTKIIGNGMVTGPYVSFNLLVGTEGISASSYPNLGVSITNNVDVEGAGGAPLAGYGFSQAAGTLTSLTVSGGVATAVCSTAPAIAVGDYIGVTGGTVANGNLAINTVRPAIIATKVGNTLTWPTTAPNGTYTTGSKIGPYVAGLGLKGCFAAKAKIYSEGTTGPGIYVYDDCRGVQVAESHVSDAKIYVDGFYFSVQISPGGSRGTGYAVNDELTLVGGVLAPGGSPTRLRVTAQTGGQIFGLAYVNQGQYLEPPLGSGVFNTITTVTNTGTGSGCIAISTWFANSAQGVDLERNQFYGSNGGITSVCHDHVTLEANQYIPTGPERPTLDLGIFIRTLAPKLRETGTRISRGITTNTGINQYVGITAPADITNYASGLAALQSLEGANDYTLPLAGKRNTAWGYRPGKDLTTGANNILGGTDVAGGLTTGGTNVILDSGGAGVPSGLEGCVAIGYGAQGFVANDRVVLGSTNITSAKVNATWTTLSDLNFKTGVVPLDVGIEFVRKLQPISYWLKDRDGNPIGTETFGYGAQDVLLALPRPTGMVDYDEINNIYGLRMADMTPVHTLALQQLDAKITALLARVEALEAAQ